jgi:threonine synthase
LLVIHSKSSLQRILTKDHVERILDGNPPLIKDPAGTIMLKAGDQRRGGWVAALGLEPSYAQKDMFMPYYYDCVQYVDQQYGDKRGRVF